MNKGDEVRIKNWEGYLKCQNERCLVIENDGTGLLSVKVSMMKTNYDDYRILWFDESDLELVKHE